MGVKFWRPGLVYMNHLGPRIRQDEEQGFDYNHNYELEMDKNVKYYAGGSS